MRFARTHLNEAKTIIDSLDVDVIERMVNLLADARVKGGRLFFLGVGGSAGNCSHAVNDFRKIVGMESYAPTDNVSELTARTNDEGWETIFVEWLKVSRLRRDDVDFCIFCRWRQSRKERQSKPGAGIAIRQGNRRDYSWCGRPRWRLHGQGGRRCLHCSDC